jgi:UDP-N-acetyl-D-glucosamine dehydrogenase
MHLLRKRGAEVTYSDPHVPEVTLDGSRLGNCDLEESVAKADCTVIVTDHDGIDYAAVVEKALLIVDTRNALKNYPSPKIVRL